MVFQYTLGDDFKNNSDLKYLKNQTIKDYQKYNLTEDKKNRALEIKTAYPNLPTGLITTLINTNADDDQVKQAAVEQEIINVKKSKPFYRTPADIANTIKKDYGQPAFSGAKRIVRFVFDLWNHTQEQLVTRGQRSRIMFARDLAQDLERQGVSDKAAKRISDIYTFNKLFPVGSPEAKAIANGLGRLIARNEFNIPEDYIGTVGASKLASYYEKAGPTSLQYTLQKISEKAELDPDDYFVNSIKAFNRLGTKEVIDTYDKLTGTGFIPMGEAEEISSQIKEANKYKGDIITTGTYKANSLGIENETLYNIVSGTIDAAILIYTDPAIAISKSRVALKQARKLQAEIKDALKAGDKRKATDIAKEILDTNIKDEVAENIINNKSSDKFINILQAVKDPAYALDLFEATNKNQVVAAAQKAALEGTSWRTPKINKTRIIPDWLSDGAYKTFGKNRQEAPLSRLGKYIPEREVNLQDWQTTVQTLINHGTVGKLKRNDLNDIAVKLTRALVDEDYIKAQSILADEYYGKLIEKVADNQKTVDYFKIHQEQARNFRRDNVVYSIDQAAKKANEGTKPISTGMLRNNKVGNISYDMQTPFPDQIMDRTFYFTDHRDLKKAVKNVDGYFTKPLAKAADTFGKDTPLGQFFAGAEVGAKELTEKIGGLYSLANGGLWLFQRAWSTANLPFRLAYPIRLVIEGQPRMAAFGLDSVVNSPVDYWRYWQLLDEDVLGKQFVTKGWSQKNRRLQEGLDKAVSNASNKHFGPKNIKGYISENFSEFNLGDELDNTDKVKRFAEAIRIQMAGIWQNDIAKNIADYTINGKSFDELAERMWSGDLKQLRINYENALTDVAPLKNVEGVRNFIDGYKKRLSEITGNDKELFESIFTGVYKNIDVRSWDRRKTENMKSITKGIENMIKTSPDRPLSVPAPDDLIGSSMVDYLKRKAESAKTIAGMPWFLAGAIEANLNRIPAYKQLYFRSVADDLVQADDKALVTLLGRIDKLPKAIKREIEELYPNIKNATGKINKNDLPKLSLEQIDTRAQAYALDEHNRILYNLSQKGLVADSLRYVFPFFEAYKEVLGSWGRALTVTPTVARRAEQIIKNGRREGIIYKDPVTDEDMISFQLSPELSKTLLGGNPEGRLRADIEVPISGFNLISTSLLPGVGPVFALPVGAFSQKVKDNIGVDIYKTIFPYGTPIDEVADLGKEAWYLEVILPSYLKSAIAAANVSGTNMDSIVLEESIASRANDSARVIALAQNRELKTPQELADFEDAVLENVKLRLMFESALKFIAPAPPRILLSHEVQYDQAEQLLEAVVGETEIGKLRVDDRKTFVAFGVLTAFYSQLKAEYQQNYSDNLEEAETLAWISFNRMIGTDKNGNNNLFGNALLKKGKYQIKRGKQPRFEKEVEFKNNNPDLFKENPLTALYLMDDIHIEGELDSDAFFESLKDGSIEAIDPLIFIIEAQEFLHDIVEDNLTKDLRGDRSDEANKLRRAIRNEVDSMFPLGKKTKDFNYEIVAGRSIKTRNPSDFNAKIEELRKMASNSKYAEVSDNWYGINNYMAIREQALIAIAEQEDYEYPNDYEYLLRKLKTGTTDLNQSIRETLRQQAQIIGANYPEFLVLYDELLKYEIQFNKE